jgi:hypothetical protein
MTSDGFNDQIGGIENKKLIYNGFLKLKIKANDINMENKRKYFQNIFKIVFKTRKEKIYNLIIYLFYDLRFKN